MFTGALGIRLQLLIGKTILRPAPYELMNAFRSLEVTNSMDQLGDGFQLSFSIGKNKSGEYSLLQSEILNSGTRVVIGIWMGTKLEPLIDGVIYNHQVLTGDQPGAATLTVSGRDVSVLMDLEKIDQNHEGKADADIVKAILQKYITKKIIQTMEVESIGNKPNANNRIPSQHESDLKYIQRLALNRGFVFYIEPVTLGVNNAYWGREKRTGLSQPALSYDLGPSTNVKSLRLMNDALAPINTSGKIFDPVSKKIRDIPPLPLRLPPLASTVSSAQRTERLRCLAFRESDEAETEATAEKIAASKPVSAEGELETIRYGSVLRPRRKVGIRGVGKSYNGDLFVESVTHRIQLGVYIQTFKLTRDGTGALSSKVRTDEQAG